MRRLLLMLVFIFGTFLQSKSQLIIFSNNKELAYKDAGIRYSIRDSVAIDDPFMQLSANNWYSLENGFLPLKKIPETIWFRIPLNSIIQNNAADYVEIREPNINFLQVWIVKNGQIIRRFEKTGDNTPYGTRAISAPGFVFPLQNETYRDCELVLATDKRHSRFYVPVFFYSGLEYTKRVKESSLVFNILLCITLFVIAYNVYLMITLRHKWFKWYIVYLLIFMIFILMDETLLFRFLYPNQPYLNDIVRPVTLTVGIIPFFLFFNSVLRLRVNNPLFYKFNKVLIWLFTYTLIIAAFTAYRSNFFLQSFWVEASRIIAPVCICVVFIESIFCWMNKVPVAGYIVLSVACTLAQIIFYILHQYSYLPYNLTILNSFYYRLVAELAIMTLAWINMPKLYQQVNRN